MKKDNLKIIFFLLLTIRTNVLYNEHGREKKGWYDDERKNSMVG